MVDPFAELRQHASSNHAQKQQLNVVLAAISEVILERKKTTDQISPTEYFAALMTALESESPHSYELISLLHIVLPLVPAAVLRAKFQPISRCFSALIQKHQEEAATVKTCISCLGLLLNAQEPSNAVWSRPALLKCFHSLLSLAMDSRPKIRHVAQPAAISVLQYHLQSKCDTLSTHVASFSENVLSSCSSQDTTKTLQLVSFLKEVLILLPEKIVGSLSEALFRVISLDQKVLVLVALQAFDTLVSASCSRLTEETIKSLLLKFMDIDLLQIRESDSIIPLINVLSKGINRIYSFKTHTSANAVDLLLPRVLATLCSIMDSKNSQALASSSKALANVIKNCIPLDKVELLSTSRIVISLESLLSLRYQNAWPYIFPLFNDIFSHFGSSSHPVLDNLIKTMGDLFEVLNDMPTIQKGTEDLFKSSVGAAIKAIGAKAFLTILPLSGQEDGVVLESRAWLLPILKDSLKVVPNELEFFSSTILQLARKCEAASHSTSILPLDQKNLHNRILQLWSLFPSFCQRPTDISSSFKKLAKTLANAMADARYPQLQLYVCQGLQALATFTKNDSVSDVPSDDRKSLAKYAVRYLPILVGLVEGIDADKDIDRLQMLLDTIAEYSLLVDDGFLNGMFKTLMQKLLKASSVESDSRRARTKIKKSHMHMSIALSLVPSLKDADIEFLYRVIKPFLLNDIDAIMQKRSYTVLVAICEHHPSFTLNPLNLRDLITSLCESLLTCSVSAKKMRLRCLYYIISSMKENGCSDLELIPSLVGEIILCTKEVNAKAREAAFELLIAMAKLVAHANRDKNGILEFFQMILGGLAAQTPHMRSAAVISISRLVFEFGKKNRQVVLAMPDLLRTIILLLHEKAREVIKAVVGFLKLAIAIIPVGQLKEFLPDIIQGLLSWIGDSKNRFRAKTKVIMTKLCRKYGYEYILELVPEQDRKLITYIKKTKEREARKRDVKKEENKQKSFDDYMNSDDSDADDDDDEVFETGSNSQPQKSWIKENAKNDEIMDFLDNSAFKNIMSNDPSKMKKSDATDFKVAKDGRLIIPMDEDSSNSVGTKKADDDESVKKDIQKQLEEMGLHTKSNKRARENEGPNDEDAGKEYRSKKAKGDMKKKGKLEPYAYIPLDPKLMAKRNKRSAVAKYEKTLGGKKKRGKRK